VRYFGKLDIPSLAEWITRKVAISNNILPNYDYMLDKIRDNKMLAIFVAPRYKLESEFRAFMKCAHSLMHMQDVEFAFLYPEDYPEIGNLQVLLDSPFYREKGFGVRVFRRGNISDYRDLNTGTTAEDMERFVFMSTFVGPGPDLIRNLNPENMMKFFSQNEPGLILFYSQDDTNAVNELEISFDKIQHRILVMKANMEEAITKNLAGLLNIEINRAQLRIVKP
jgi:hypothetical protein